MSFKSGSSTVSDPGVTDFTPQTQVLGDIIRCGLLKKMKTSRKKWFVLRGETPDTLARLEYYDSEKKFRNGLPPKRCIPLKTCFNINKRHDTKYKHVIALYTKDDCFCVVMDNEEDMEVWLKDLLTLQHGEEIPEGETPRPKFEFVWQVSVCSRGLGTNRVGAYRLCLTDKTLTLVRIEDGYAIELQLASIRSCGNLKNFFFMEIGRSSQLGAGELWIEADDSNIAYNIQTTVYHRFKICRAQMATSEAKDDIRPEARIRSSSATESSKPTTKRYIFSAASKSHIFPQDTSQSVTTAAPVLTTTTSTSSSNTGGGLGNSGSICHQRTQSLPLESPTAIVTAPNLTDNNHLLTTTATVTNTTNSHPRSVSVTKRPSQSSRCFRERCDSMPSRPRTTSEGTHTLPVWTRHNLVPHRPHIRDISHSPPTGSPISPPSDSTGSSYSLQDEHDGGHEQEQQRMCNIPLTPDEVIAEEDCPDSPYGANNDYVPMSRHQNSDVYMEMMSPHGVYNASSNSTSMSSVTSGTPSTDLKFSDYPLDKVISYFSTEEDDARPGRSFSVGSKPPGILRRMEQLGENSRTRAFSVGSKTKKVFNRVLPPHHPQPPGIKSNSAPLLLSNNSRIHGSHSSHGSYSSIDPMDDLVEMDFSSGRGRVYTNASPSPYVEMRSSRNNEASNKTPSGYVEMKPGVDPNGRSLTTEVSPYVDMTQGNRSSYVDMTLGNSNNNAYMDMSGSSPLRNSATSPNNDINGDICRQYHRNTANEYMDMSGQRRNRTNSSSSFTRSATSPGYQWPSDYMDMSGGSRRTDRQSNNSQLSSTPNGQSVSPRGNDYISLSIANNNTNRIFESASQIPNRTYEGYVEMTPAGMNRHQRQSSLDSSSASGNEDYLNVSNGAIRKPERKPSKKEKARSQPIAISTTSNNQATKNTSPLSISSISSLLGRKNSTGMHLPLSSWSSSPYSSLPRQKNRKNNSPKDSSSSSVTTTPSSSSTMFPLSLNSPASPPSKTTTPIALKIPASILNTVYKPNKKAKGEDKGHTVMDLGNTSKTTSTAPSDTSEYMKYCPADKAAVNAPVENTIKPSQAGDYVLMKPSGQNATKSATLPLVKNTASGRAPSLVSHLSHVGLSEPLTMFRPIKEKEERQGPSPDSRSLSRPVENGEPSKPVNMEVEEPVYETLRGGDFASKVSRPGSSSSDKIKSTSPRPGDKTSRPPSVCSDSKLQNSRPGSTSSVYSGSSVSTVVGGSRPESVNGERMELHYASLDLPAADQESSPKNVKNTSETSLVQCEPTFVYAEIDFIKSEGFKNNSSTASGSLSNNTKVN